MRTLDIILYVAAFLCFLLAVADVKMQRPRGPMTAVHFAALGLAIWVLVPLIAQIHAANQ